jgi:hypothetical protein
MLNYKGAERRSCNSEGHAYFCLVRAPAGSWYTDEGWRQNSVNRSGSLDSGFNDKDVGRL